MQTSLHNAPRPHQPDTTATQQLHSSYTAATQQPHSSHTAATHQLHSSHTAATQQLNSYTAATQQPYLHAVRATCVQTVTQQCQHNHANAQQCKSLHNSLPKSCNVVQMYGAPKKDALFHFCHSPLPSTLMSITTNLPGGTESTNPRKLDPATCKNNHETAGGDRAGKAEHATLLGVVPVDDGPALEGPNCIRICTIQAHVCSRASLKPCWISNYRMTLQRVCDHVADLTRW